MMNNEQSNILTRRKFLNRLWAGLGILAGIELIGLSFTFLSPNKGVSSGNNLKIIGAVGDFPNDSVIPYRSGKFYLVRLPDGGFMALSLACTHLGCSIHWNAENKRFICPCHSSEFDMQGKVINAPAPRPLDQFPVIIENGMVKVETSRQLKRNKSDKLDITYA